jgi:hypothetical protein
MFSLEAQNFSKRQCLLKSADCKFERKKASQDLQNETMRRPKKRKRKYFTETFCFAKTLRLF